MKAITIRGVDENLEKKLKGAAKEYESFENSQKAFQSIDKEMWE